MYDLKVFFFCFFLFFPFFKKQVKLIKVAQYQAQSYTITPVVVEVGKIKNYKGFSVQHRILSSP